MYREGERIMGIREKRVRDNGRERWGKREIGVLKEKKEKQHTYIY